MAGSDPSQNTPSYGNATPLDALGDRYSLIDAAANEFAPVPLDGSAQTEKILRERTETLVRMLEQKAKRENQPADPEQRKLLAELNKPDREGNRAIDVLKRLGFEQVFQQNGLAFQAQLTVEKTISPKLGLLEGFSFRGIFQVALKGEFLPGSDINKLTLRLNADSKALVQQEIEFRGNLGSFDWDGFKIVETKVLLTADSPPDQGFSPTKAKPPSALRGRFLLGVEATCELSAPKGKQKLIFDTLRLSSVGRFKFRLAAGVDLSKLLDPATAAQAFVAQGSLTFPFPATDLPFVGPIFNKVGGMWSGQVKLIGELSGRYDAWARLARTVIGTLVETGEVVVQGGRFFAAGAGQTAVQVGQKVAAVAEKAVLLTGRAAAASAEGVVTFVESGLAATTLYATAAAFATAAAGLYAIGAELRRGRRESIARAFIRGYASELDASICRPYGETQSEYRKLSGLHFSDELAKITADVNASPGTPDRAFVAGMALENGAVQLGRAALLRSVIQLCLDYGPETWGIVQMGERAKKAELKARNIFLKSRYLELLDAQVGGDVRNIGFDLNQLRQLR